MVRALKVFGWLLAVLVVLVGALFVASESDEVVELATFEDACTPHTTKLWVVDLEDGPYLRAGSTQSAWFGRVRRNPLAIVRRGSKVLYVRLVIREARTKAVNAHMRRKYGVADQIVGLFIPPEQRVALKMQSQPWQQPSRCAKGA